MKKINHPLFSVVAAKFIREFCKPLHNIALTNFMHDITFGKNQITMLVSSEDLFLFYYQNKIPTLCTDDSGRTLAAGIYLNKMLETNYQACSVLMPLMPKIGRQFNQNYGKNSLHIVTRENDCQHLYSLFFDLEENDFLYWVINNGNYLADLMENYHHAAKDIILEAKALESRILLPNSSDFISTVHDENNSGIKKLCLIHKYNNIPINLSKQQSICFSLLMQGKSAKKIAIDMKLSRRTVEAYIQTIRSILGCSTSNEMIALYGDQFFFDMKRNKL